MDEKLVSPRVTSLLIKRYNLRLRRGWGQNFLVDENILRKIVDAADLHLGDRVLEVGAGFGTLTQALVEGGARVVAIEIDRGLARAFRENFKGSPAVALFEGDVRRLDLRDLCFRYWRDQQVKVVANLPYYLTTPLMFQILQEGPLLERIVVMVQKELAQRMVARPGTKEYGLLTVLCQLWGTSELLFTVPRTVFIPRPSVDSAVIRLRVEPSPVKIGDQEMFWKLVRAAFQHRRKTLLKVLVQSLGLPREEGQRLLAEEGIDPQQRGETLTVEKFANLSCLIYNRSV